MRPLPEGEGIAPSPLGGVPEGIAKAGMRGALIEIRIMPAIITPINTLH